MTCVQCQRHLNPIDIALTKKLINRGSEQYYCKCCLAKLFRVSEEYLTQKAMQFQKQGCMLFADIIIEE